MAAIINLPSSPKVSVQAEKPQQAQSVGSEQSEGFSQALSQQMEKKQTGTEKPADADSRQVKSDNATENQSVKASGTDPEAAQKQALESAQPEPDSSLAEDVAEKSPFPMDSAVIQLQQPGLQELLGLVLGRGNTEDGKELPLMAKLGESSVPRASIAEVMAARNSRLVQVSGSNLPMDEHALLLQQQQLVLANQPGASADELKLALRGIENALQSLSRTQGDHGELKGLEQAREQLVARLQGLQGQHAQSNGGNSSEQQANSSKLPFMQNSNGEEAGKLSELSKLTRVAFQEMLAQQQPANGQAQTAGMGALLAGPSISMNSLSAMLSPASAGNPLLNYATSSSSLNVPVNHPAWGQAVGERLQWMVKQDVQEAQLKLNPRNMGPIEIKISMNQDQATVSFVANHAMTREALDAAIPRLREMFGESGLNLVDVNVAQNPDTSGQRAGEGGNESANGHAANIGTDITDIDSKDSALDNAAARNGPWHGSNGVLDAYA
ncbi:MAG: flagellar hook-length control protein FliK [Gammaproteobacteria bacterium]|nr:flagellar hook-length control protein FliK [Gammaproteobacteria bacterium]